MFSYCFLLKQEEAYLPLPLYLPYQPPSLLLLVPQSLCCFHGICAPFFSFHPLPPSFSPLLLLVRMCSTHTKINNWTMSQHPSSCTCHSLIFLYSQIKSQYRGTPRFLYVFKRCWASRFTLLHSYCDQCINKRAVKNLRAVDLCSLGSSYALGFEESHTMSISTSRCTNLCSH